jgi:hypothetical protein
MKSVSAYYTGLKDLLGRELGAISEAIKIGVMPQFDFSHLEVSFSGDRECEDFLENYKPVLCKPHQRKS